MKSGIVKAMIGMLAAGMQTAGNNVHEIKASPYLYEPVRVTPIKRNGMSLSEFHNKRRACGHPKRHKNLANCARKAKLKRRRAA